MCPISSVAWCAVAMGRRTPMSSTLGMDDALVAVLHVAHISQNPSPFKGCTRLLVCDEVLPLGQIMKRCFLKGNPCQLVNKLIAWFTMIQCEMVTSKKDWQARVKLLNVLLIVGEETQLLPTVSESKQRRASTWWPVRRVLIFRVSRRNFVAAAPAICSARNESVLSGAIAEIAPAKTNRTGCEQTPPLQCCLAVVRQEEKGF